MVQWSRLTLVVPVSRIAAGFGFWWQACIDPADDCSTWEPLNSTGDPNDPVTHRWCSTAMTDSQVDALKDRLIAAAQLDPPTDWSERSRSERYTWLASRAAAIYSRIGVSVIYADNATNWGRLTDAIDALGLRPCSS